jgi:hypothetical protein
MRAAFTLRLRVGRVLSLSEVLPARARLQGILVYFKEDTLLTHLSAHMSKVRLAFSHVSGAIRSHYG